MSFRISGLNAAVVAMATSEAVRMPIPCMAKTEPTKAPRLRAVENSAAIVAESFGVVEFFYRGPK